MYGGNVIKIMSGERKFIIGLKVQKQIALSVLELLYSGSYPVLRGTTPHW